MPKILINEKDRTSPGAPGGYANYAVLIAGVQPRTPILTEEDVEAASTDDKKATIDAIKPDSNGVYEFSSAEDFKKTIGLDGPEVDLQTGEGSTTSVKHYGNQMAYELLNMGYSIIYKPINSGNIEALDFEEFSNVSSEDFWSIFRDKASYDFRFITHGLLESSIDIDQVENHNNNKKRLKLLEEICAKLESIRSEADTAAQDAVKDQVTNPGLEYEQAFASALTDKYNEALTSYVDENGKSKFVDASGNPYANWAAADEAFSEEKTGLEKDIKAFETGYTNSITTGFINEANKCIADLAMYKATGDKDTNGDATNDMYMKELPGRGDCIALIEMDEKCYISAAKATTNPESRIIDSINDMKDINAANGKFCAMTVPSVYYKMAIKEEEPNEFDNNVKFPGAFHYLACFMNSLNLGFNEWYAAAGYTRGVASYMIKNTSVKLGEIAINALEPRNIDDQKTQPKFACNVIANFRGSYYLWGNRTAHPLGEKGSLDTGDLVASHFLNIRQLCCTIKKQLYVACRRFTFDPNSDTLWFNFVNAIKPTLEAMKADQGIRDYKIMKVYTDKKAMLKAKIRVIPIEAVEDFDLEVSLEDSFGETAAVVTE